MSKACSTCALPEGGDYTRDTKGNWCQFCIGLQWNGPWKFGFLFLLCCDNDHVVVLIETSFWRIWFVPWIPLSTRYLICGALGWCLHWIIKLSILHMPLSFCHWFCFSWAPLKLRCYCTCRVSLCIHTPVVISWEIIRFDQLTTCRLLLWVHMWCKCVLLRSWLSDVVPWTLSLPCLLLASSLSIAVQSVSSDRVLCVSPPIQGSIFVLPPLLNLAMMQIAYLLLPWYTLAQSDILPPRGNILLTRVVFLVHRRCVLPRLVVVGREGIPSVYLLHPRMLARSPYSLPVALSVNHGNTTSSILLVRSLHSHFRSS